MHEQALIYKLTRILEHELTGEPLFANGIDFVNSVCVVWIHSKFSFLVVLLFYSVFTATPPSQSSAEQIST